VLQTHSEAPLLLQVEQRTWKYYAALINNAWRRGAADFIQTGRYLLEAKEELDRDQFEALVKLQLDFDASVARKLMCIAGDRALCAHVHKLPPSWSVIYELSKLEDDTLEAAVADGRVNPKMQRRDAVALRKPLTESEDPPPAEPEPAEPAPTESDPAASADDGAVEHDHLDDHDVVVAPAPEPTAPAKSDKPEETLVDHWRRCPAERGVLLDVVGIEAIITAMSPDLHATLRARQLQPANLLLRLRDHDLGAAAQLLLDAYGWNRLEMIIAKVREMRAPKAGKPAPTKPFTKTLNLTAVASAPGEDTVSGNDAGKRGDARSSEHHPGNRAN
jgi:hypothetical protein